MKRLQTIILSVVAVCGLVTMPLLATVDVKAACSDPKNCIQQGANVQTGTGKQGLGELIKNVVNILLFVLGAIAVIMIVVGGIRYTLSNGDSSAITGAKNTILYSVIGLIVALLAYAIVNFVLDAFN